jgi:four helix bundle protein
MTYGRFEDTPVWQAAIELAYRVFDLVESDLFVGVGDLRNQLQRASLSISNNIAEGFERGTTNELISFLYIARGSAGEVRSALRFADGRPGLASHRSEIGNLIALSESVSRQIRAWASSLQNSDIQGQKALNDRSKAEFDQRRRSAGFWEKLQAIREGAMTPQAAFGQVTTSESQTKEDSKSTGGAS